MPKIKVGLFSALFFMLGCGAALADMVIDIFPTSTGWRIQDASGALVGNVESQQTIQRLANTYARKGYTVNWRSALPATTGTTAVTTTPRPGSNLPATTVQPGQNLPTTTNGGGSTGGTGVGVGLMELFGNRLIGGKVMGQKSLDEMELLYSQMSETERREYQAAADKLVELCDELYQKGATSPLCE